MRHDHARKSTRIIDALRAGEMSATELAARLRVHDVTDVLRALERDGRVTQISPASGAEASRWTLRRGAA